MAIKLIDELLKAQGVIDTAFGEHTKQLVYDTNKERIKLLIRNAYNKEDIFMIFPPDLDETKFFGLMKTLYSYY
jgi:hypothetical protein